MHAINPMLQMQMLGLREIAAALKGVSSTELFQRRCLVVFVLKSTRISWRAAPVSF